ncbi:hypothetical protein Bbelb_415060 [Branchiostoma belcheri]|nr:hypothetical protein Bbelb_415060 [Branchiostoma belcheri]
MVGSLNLDGPAWLERSPDWPIERTETNWPDAADADKVLDGRYSSHWNPRGRGGPWYIIFDLVVPYTLFKIRITNYGDRTHDVSMFLLEASASSDPYRWEDVVTVTEVAVSSEIQEFGGFSATGRFWKLNITNTHGTWQPWLREVNFFGAGDEIVVKQPSYVMVHPTTPKVTPVIVKASPISHTVTHVSSPARPGMSSQEEIQKQSAWTVSGWDHMI